MADSEKWVTGKSSMVVTRVGSQFWVYFDLFNQGFVGVWVYGCPNWVSLSIKVSCYVKRQVSIAGCWGKV